MGDKKHIDRLFQERFKDFEVQPDHAVWDKIEEKLNEKKKKRRVIPIWWRYAGVAALLLLTFTIGKTLFNNDTTTHTIPQIVDTEQIDTENTVTKNSQHNTKSKSIISDDNTSIKDNNNAIAADKTDSGSLKSDVNRKEDNTKPAASQVKETIIPKKQSSSIATTKTKEKSVEQSFKAPSKVNTPAIITYKNHISKTDIATGTKNETLDNNTTDIVKNNVVGNQNQTTIALDTTNSENKTNATTKTTEVVEVAEHNSQKEKQSIEDAIKQNNSLLEEDKKTEVAFNKWSVAPNVAPVYFSSLGKGSSLDAQFNENSKSGEVNMSFGLNASYAINKRFTVRSGVNRVNLGYNTNDVVVFNSVNASANAKTLNTLSSTVTDNVAEMSSISAGENVSIMSATAFKSSSINDFETNTTSINQSFGFIEIPLELQYALSNKRFGVNVIGGFSSLFLNNYESASLVEGQRTVLQENEDNINNTSYSANFGLGVNYRITEKINFNFEPMFKYQINTFRNTSGDFQPFFIGVYTGFGIKF